jgi:hypothetical protein
LKRGVGSRYKIRANSGKLTGIEQGNLHSGPVILNSLAPRA